MKKILVSDPIAPAGLSILEKAGFDVLDKMNADPSELADSVGEISGWVIRSGTKVNADILEQAKDLQVVGRAGVGVDNIDIPAATRKGVVVMNTPDVNTVSAAEHTIAVMLSLSRNIHLGHAGLAMGEWNRHALVGSELRGKSLGIVGMGKIGREVMTRCRSFDMNVLGFDPFLNPELFNPEEVTMMDLDSLLKQADFITLHVPLTDDTRDLIDSNKFTMMKPTARIINVARGGIINEKDLADALNSDRIAGAAVDVFTEEPLPQNHPLLSAKNIVLTPHLGASTEEAKEGVSIAVCEQVRDFLLEGKLTGALNMPISDPAKLGEIQPFLDLAESMGSIQSQLAGDVIVSAHVECAGTIEEVKPVVLAFLKGLLKSRTPERINFINAETLAMERGIKIEEGRSSDSGAYTNLVRTKLISTGEKNCIDGSVFDGGRLRLVNILGNEMDVTPRGTMIFATNKDVPGVIGKVGTMLGESGVNIGAYLLGRKKTDGEAFAVIRVDSKLPKDVMSKLEGIPEIVSIRQLSC
ncbi:MAG: phosphoglycerate dehydrogenase [Candidatus Marinimicrobia bacterium]|jgi:D-3-phosphoglycerate dehydrogenase|nr:phosphoglycerate dehydrogenase [Candidatus Neomarinimicrobiota bacterium]MBT3617184.1 phosphoglycerate dehydrogenase [Candidatus Neomarinimicrobiota bacterium]MBT3829779.1 phosphoglycerate dehydrogenase [Candidatus Neomarinimicrobiota bacterium]MBT3997874.1 phosphoglycerate dehydrogenase [Candidatus Neomarinimicrobiota bacterium]MBT4281252.1 phosphoglycerate dehydrogenase [Candidatus Neomarinimicrobiota bacterium]